MNKKKLAVVSLVLCLAAILSMTSLAWFTAEDSVANTLSFMEATDFVVDVIEHDPENPETVIGADSDPIGNTYENLLPNQLIAKDPTVINKSKTEDQFIRVTVTLTNADKWQEIIEDGTDLATIFEGFDGTKWTRYDDPTVVAGGDNKGTISYTFYLNEKLTADGGEANLFTGVRIPADVEKEDVEDLQATQIIVKAEAIQTTGFSADATAYTAFNTPDDVKEVTGTEATTEGTN